MSRSYSSRPADAAQFEEIVALYVAGVASSAEQKELENKLSRDPSLGDLISAAREAMQSSGSPTLEGYDPPPLDFNGGKIKLRNAAPATAPPSRVDGPETQTIWRVLPPPEVDMTNIAGCRAELVRTDDGRDTDQAASSASTASQTSAQQPQQRLASLCRCEPPAAGPAEMHDIHRSETVQATLDLLLQLASPAGLKSIRYFPFVEESDSPGRLFQFAVAGVNDDIQPQCATHLSRFTDTSSLHSSAAFWPFFLSTPVLVSVDEDASTAVQCYWQEGRLPVLRVAESAAAGLESKVWVEFPQIIRGKPVGKICCELNEPVTIQGKSPAVSIELSQRLALFGAYVESVTPLLRWLFEHELAEADGANPEGQPLSTATEMLRGAVEQCTSVRELNGVCTQGLSRLLYACSAAMFSFEANPQRGKDGLLVMRSSTDEDVCEQENLASFKEPPASSDDFISPLAWVVQSQRSVCVSGVRDEVLRDAAMAQYSPDIRWDIANPLAEVFRKGVENLLIANLPAGPALGSGGALCFVHHVNDESTGGFTAAQQYWLEEVVRDVIAPKYRSLFQERRAQNMQRIGSGVNALSVRDSAAVEQAILQQLRELALETMPVLPESRQAFYVSLADLDGVSFRAHLIDDKLGAELHDAKIPLAGSLTQQAMQQTGVIYLNDLPAAAADGRYAANVPHACVALACGISFGQREYGAMVLESDRYSLNPYLHGGALQMLAAFAAESFAARDLAAMCEGQPAVAHLLGEVEKFAASEADEECVVRTTIDPSLRFSASQKLLQIVWRLLRCAWQKSKHVTIEASSDDNFLEVRLRWNSEEGRTAEASEQGQRLAGFYLATAQQMAESVRTDLAHGSLTVVDDEFVLRLPLR